MLFSTSKKVTRVTGFALIVTLIMVTLAAVMVVALLSSASLDRGTAKSVNERYQADLAVQNGLEAAKKALIASPTAAAPVIADDTFSVLRADGTQGPNSSGNKDTYYFLAKAQTGNTNKIDCYPLFSGGSTSQLTIDHSVYPPVQRPAAPTAPFPNPAQDTFGSTTKQYPQLLTFHQPAYTQWQELSDPNDTAVAPAHNLPYQRYAFWIEDLGGYLDASIVGNSNGPGSLHQRITGINPREIALFTVFDPSLTNDSGNTIAKNLLDNRALLLTIPTLQQVASPPPAPTPTGQADLTQPNLAVRLGIDIGGEQNLIPFGFGFRDEGKPKTNLNTIILDATKSDDEKVIALAKVVNDNLPQFSNSRKGGLSTTEDYTRTLAAGMISYATSQPIVGSGYRGVGHHPFVVEFFERFTWEKNGSETTNFYLRNGTWWANVRAIGYIELWNMSDRQIDSGTFTFNDINRFYAYVGGTSDQNKFEDNFGKGSVTFTPSNTLQSNEFKVFKIYEHVYNFDTGLTSRPIGSAATVKLASFSGSTTDPTTCGYFCEWNGKQVERAGLGILDGSRDDGTDGFPGLQYSGLDRNYVSLSTPNSASDPSWRGTLPGLRYDNLSETLFNLGDPRSAYYINKVQASVAYASSGGPTSFGQSAWWGRMYQDGLVNHSGWKAAETAVASWPDGGHSTTKGLLPSSTSVDPMTLAPAPATESTKAPMHITSAGKYVSITELGHIYDPIQWKPANFPPTSRADFTQKWRDAWKSNMTSDPNYGCASTLHVGSPEFKDFDTDNARAARLLDLFTVTDRNDTRGLVNLNTASRESLRALAAGTQIGSNNVDGAITPSTVYGPLNDPASPVQADRFADAVINNRPFITQSQLSGIATTPG